MLKHVKLATIGGIITMNNTGETLINVLQVPHYAPNKALGKMKKGHVFTIEPMLNLGTHSDLTWPDGWTSVTQDVLLELSRICHFLS